MPRNKGNKRAKTAHAEPEAPGPLGSKSKRPVAEKDDEERELESALFGVPFIAATAKSGKKLTDALPEDSAAPGGLGHVLDTELFFFDAGEPSTSQSPRAQSPNAETPLKVDSDGFPKFDDEDEIEQDNDSDAPSTSSFTPKATTTSRLPFPLASSSRQGPAWIDPSDTNVKVSLKNDKRLRKLRDGPEHDVITGREYESKLRQQFERINPTPSWAVSAREKLHDPRRKRRRLSTASDESFQSDSEDAVENLLHSTTDIMNTSERPRLLPPTTLDIMGLRDSNQAGKSEAEVSSVRFHPSPTVPVLLTAGSDRRLRLFNIDGLTNPLLQTVHVPTLPITNAQFHPSGQSVLMTGQRPYFFSYDLQSGAIVQSARGLWSSLAFTNDGKDQGDRSMEICKFSDDGKLLAVGGRGGYVHLLHCGAGGASAQVVGSVKMNRSLKDLEWCGSTSNQLMTVSNDGQAFIWDVGTRKCLRTWTDTSAFGSTTLARGGDGKYFALGAKSGIVNMYNSEAVSPHSASTSVSPLKALDNLITPISTIRFDPSCQIMAMASKYKPNQLRMVHLPSLTVFANWPTMSTPLGVVMSVDFSAGSEYVAIGNNRGRALLYNLKHFGTR